jgi:hypothetical protein
MHACAEVMPAIEHRLNSGATADERASPAGLQRLLTESSRSASARVAAVEQLARQAGELAEMEYGFQYRAFGVPGLGLKRGLSEDLVVAPYASALALMVAPEQACLNLERLAAAGLEWNYGFYEAIDYTPSRLPRGQASAVVHSYMAHHQGMSFLALAYNLLEPPFDKSALNRGYIKGYVPGVRENGGQYTHAAIWTAMAFAELGDNQRALYFSPCLPANWNGFKMHYRYRETVYHIAVLQTSAGSGEMRVTVDGLTQPDKSIPLVDDQREHRVEVRMDATNGALHSLQCGCSEMLPGCLIEGRQMHAGSNPVSSDTFHFPLGSIALTFASQHMQNIWCMIWLNRLIQYFCFYWFTEVLTGAALPVAPN